MRVLDARAGAELAAEGLEGPHPQPHARRAGQRHLLLVRAGPLHGEQLQLAPRRPHCDGLAAAGGAGVPLGAGPGALSARHLRWPHPLCRGTGVLRTLPVLGGAQCGADSGRKRQRRPPDTGAAVPAGAVLRGCAGGLVRRAVLPCWTGCINTSAAGWLNCSKQHTIPG